MQGGDDRRRVPSDDFHDWPESAQEAYLAARARVHRMKEARDALREKRKPGEGGGVSFSTPSPSALRSLDELTLPWAELMDGRIHRLKRGKHFSGEVSAVIEEARLAARITGRGVLHLREQMGMKYQYVWVQFTDDAIVIGDPCPCGSRRLTRLHLNLARCQRCGRILTLTPR
jgi:hypothetical protein